MSILSRFLFLVCSIRKTYRPAPRRRRVGHALCVEALEDRTLPSAYVMTTTADSGAGSFRDAITQVNADTSHALYASPSNPSVDEIDFNITVASDVRLHGQRLRTGHGDGQRRQQRRRLWRGQ